MPTNLPGMSGAKSMFAGFTSGQKTVTVLALIALLGGGFFFATWASAPSMVPVFTNLSAEDAAAVTEELTTQGVQYDLADGGATVLVPKDKVYQLRIDLSAAGLPKGGTAGYELLDSQGITTSEFRQRVGYQRALEGELSKTISSIDGVEAAIVHLVIPEDNLFSEDSRQPSASILVRNKPGKTLAGGQVQAVVNLVSSSVEGLPQDRVTVADDKGTVLSGTGPDGNSAAAGDARATQTASFESGLQKSIQEMLLPVTGAGNAVVRVKADLDFDAKETRTETFETDKQAPVVSETIGDENFEGTGQVVGGVLGPENAAGAPGGGQSTYDKNQASRTYAVGKVTEKAKSAPGKVNRLSVAVLLDSPENGPVPNQQEIQALVTAAAGLDTARGDVVEVSTMEFDQTAADTAAAEFAKIEAAEKREQMVGLIRTGVIVLVVLIVMFLAWRSMRKDRRTVIDLPAQLTAQQMTDLATAQEIAALRGVKQALEPAYTSEEMTRQAIRTEIDELVDSQPEEVATLLRGWLTESKD